MSERDLAELAARIWEVAGYPTSVERHDGRTFVVAGTEPRSVDLLWVVPANENQQLAAAWIDVYDAILADLRVGRPYLITTGGASDEAHRAAARSDVILIDRDNLERLLRQSGIGTERLETPTTKAAPTSTAGGGGASGTELDVQSGIEAGTAKTGSGSVDEGHEVDDGADGGPAGDSSAHRGGDEGGESGDEDIEDLDDIADLEDLDVGGGDDDGVAMVFDDDGGTSDTADDESETDPIDASEDDDHRAGGGGGVGARGGGGGGSDGDGAPGDSDRGSGGDLDLDSLQETDQQDSAGATGEESSSRRRFVAVGLGVIGVSVLGIVDRLWLHLVLGGGGGGVPSYNETRVKRDATTIATGSLVQNADSLTSEGERLALRYDGVVVGATSNGGYQRLEIAVQSGDRNVLGRWDGQSLAVGTNLELWGVFAGTESVEGETESRTLPIVNVVSVSVSGNPGGSAGNASGG
jgi:hypothetical protein